MILTLIGNDFHYELENICKIFFPGESVEIIYEEKQGERTVCARMSEKAGTFSLDASVRIDGSSTSHTRSYVPDGTQTDMPECERLLAAAVYDCFCELCGFYPEWGILTGVRPAKLMHMKRETLGRQGAVDYFTEKMLVSREKAMLSAEVADSEERIRSLSVRNSCSIYVSIPFCPTRCSYCSFVSHSIEHSAGLIEPYLDCLCRELSEIALLVSLHGLQVETVYIGGGTPSILSASQTKRLLGCINECFDLSCLREFTFEAGRPDTVTGEKLTAVFEGGARRISINPQSFCDETLERIGRRHTSLQTVAAYESARAAGDFEINMDLIAGLDGETAEIFADSVTRAVSLRPENITVHSLAMKRSSRQVAEGLAKFCAGGDRASRMLSAGARILRDAGYRPYYMYRQSKTVENLENVGWTLPGHDGLYNVYMMDETHTILSAGGGAVTKIRQPGSTRIERVFNYKYPYEYISRFDEMLARKKTTDKLLSELYR